MSQAALLSPSLASASFPDPLTARPFTPDTGAARVQKQVVRVKAQRDEVLVNIYIRMAVPKSNVTQTVPLFSDEGVTLKNSQVFPITLGKAGRPILPHDASRRLQKAAEVLSLRCATTSTAPLNINGSSISREGESDLERHPKRKAKVTISNFQVALLVPSDTEAAPSAEGSENQRNSYIAVIQLGIPVKLRPPKWPYMIHVPVARCLNNQLQFFADESCVDDDTVLEVDPPLLPKPTKSLLTRQNSSSSDSVYTEEGDGEQSLSGPFYSTTGLSIRWARANAGASKNESSSSDHPLVSASLLEAFTFFSSPKKIDEDSAEVVLEVEARLVDPSHAGLDAVVSLELDLIGADWVSDSISVIPATTSTATFHSFSTSRATKTSVHSIRSSISAADGNEKASSQEGDRSDDAFQDEPDATLDEGGTLLNIRPPKGFTSSDFGASSDSEEDTNDISPSKRRSTLRRRHSLGKAMHLPSPLDQPPFPNRPILDAKTIYVYLNTASLCQGKGDFSFIIRAKAKVKVHREEGDRAVVGLPYLKARGVPLHHKVSVKDVECKIVEHNKLVELREGGRDAAHSLDLPADFDDSKFGATLASLKWGLDRVNEQHSSQAVESSDSDSLETFANTSFHTEKNYNDTASQAGQVDSLSGVIQQASAEVTISTIGAVPSPIAESPSPPKKLESTHLIRSTWPCTPAPQSTWLPRMVIAIPCQDDNDARVLYAGINGLCVDYDAKGDKVSSKHTRIVELQLPQALRQADKVEMSLIYVHNGLIASTLCAFPLLASSVAELSIKLDYSAIPSLIPTINFSLAPLSHSEKFGEGEGTATAQAIMLPSMTSVGLSFTVKAPREAVPIAPLQTASLRRAAKPIAAKAKARWLFRTVTIMHMLCTIGLLLASFVAWHVFEPLLDLPRRVNILALATEVDLRDGTARPGAGIFDFPEGWETSRGASWAPVPARSHRSQPIYTSPTIRESRSSPSHSQTQTQQTTHDLSTETRSFAEILHSLSHTLASTLVWPLRLLYSLFYVA